jgi:protein tyrosine/serine phosphatase
VTARALSWDGCVNVRDLGGLPTADGGQTRRGAVVRADCVRLLSDAGWEALVAYGVRRVVDLRFPEELAEDAPRELPVEVVHVSVFGELDAEYGAELDRRLAAIREPAERIRAAYGEFLARRRQSFAEAVAAVADAPAGAVLVHCTGGKDRTGLVSALLLSVAGVPAEEVADDYAATAPALRVLDDRWIAAAPEERERGRTPNRDGVPREAMLGVLADLEERFGGVEEFLLGGGLAERQRGRVRERLLGP